MIMTNEEIVRDYRQAKNRSKQIGILAELNGCKKSDIVKILVDAGETVPRNYAAYEKKAAGTEAEAADGGILRSAQNDSKGAQDDRGCQNDSKGAQNDSPEDPVVTFGFLREMLEPWGVMDKTPLILDGKPCRRLAFRVDILPDGAPMTRVELEA